jgi:epoxide hydrolase-like predicted phosphatase
MGSEDGRRRGLLVDYGGVLTSSPFASFRAFCELEGIDPDALGERLRSDPAARELVFALETGELPEEQFELQFAELLGVTPDGLIDRLFAHYSPDQPMIGAVRRARALGIRTGLISNSWGTRRYDRRRLHQLFDAVVISGDEGIRKPAPEIYQLGIERIGLSAADCVFVDDLPSNLAPAAELGMATVHHVDAEQTVAELEQWLAVPLR